MSSKRFDQSYADTKGTDSVYKRDPGQPVIAKNAARKLAGKKKDGRASAVPDKTQTGKGIPSAMTIYEPWMEPGGWPDAKPDEPPPPPKRPPTAKQAPPPRKPQSKYRYFSDYSDEVELEKERQRQAEEEEERQRAKEQKRLEEQRKREEQKRQEEQRRKREAEEEAERRREEEALRQKREEEAERERRRARARNKPAASANEAQLKETDDPPTTPEQSPPPSSDESDYDEFHSWIRNGRDDDLHKSRHLLFNKRKKKR